MGGTAQSESNSKSCVGMWVEGIEALKRL